jgi:hypothetical protein
MWPGYVIRKVDCWIVRADGASVFVGLYVLEVLKEL